MKKRVIGIYSQEMGYASRLMDYLSARGDLKKEARIFTSEESLNDCLKEQAVDVLLVDEALQNPDRQWGGETTVIWLTEERGPNGDGENSIYKFQKLEQIAKELLRIWLQEGEEADGTVGANEVFAVFTPYGDAGEASWALAQVLAESYRTLLLDMGWCPNGWEGQKGLTDLLYFIQERKKNVPLYVASLMERRGRVDVVAPICHFKDLMDLEGEDVRHLLKELKGNGNYDKVVLQMDFFGEYTFDAWELCDRILLPIWRNDTGRRKVETLRRYLRMEGKEGVEERIHVTEVPIQSGSQGYLRKAVGAWLE